MSLLSGGGWPAILALIGIVAVWIVFMLMARRWLRGPATELKNPVEDSTGAEAEAGERLAISDAPSHKES